METGEAATSRDDALDWALAATDLMRVKELQEVLAGIPGRRKKLTRKSDLVEKVQAELRAARSAAKTDGRAGLTAFERALQAVDRAVESQLMDSSHHVASLERLGPLPVLISPPNGAAASVPPAAAAPAPAAAAAGVISALRSPPAAAAAASGGAGSSGSHAAGQRQVLCVCSDKRERGIMMRCGGCGVWQHGDCVQAPPQPAGRPTEHWCEACRVQRADPFWKQDWLLMLPESKIRHTGRNDIVGTSYERQQQIDVTFQLGSHLARAKQDPERHKVQVWCLQLNDPVPFRCHWPRGLNVYVNGTPCRPHMRAGSDKLGANQRDNPASIASLCHSGAHGNTLKVQGVDNRHFALVLQLATLRTLDQVKLLMRPPETLQESTARVAKQMGGGGGAQDDDDDVQVTHARLSLRCPLSATRIKVPARFVDVPGMACFDLDAFLSMVEKTRRWQCPHSMRNSCVQNLQVDTYTLKVVEALAAMPSVTEVEVSPEGKWRPAGSASARLNPDGAWYNAGEKAAEVVNRHVSVVGDSDEEEDETEELRRAAAAVRGASAAPGSATPGQQGAGEGACPPTAGKAQDTGTAAGGTAATPATGGGEGGGGGGGGGAAKKRQVTMIDLVNADRWPPNKRPKLTTPNGQPRPAAADGDRVVIELD